MTDLGWSWFPPLGDYAKVDSQPWSAGDVLQLLATGNEVESFSEALPTGPPLAGVVPPLRPSPLLARLAASVPPPRLHLVRYSGVFAPASPWRPLVIPPVEPASAATPETLAAPPAHTKPPPKPPRTGPRCHYWSWAELMRLTLGLPVDTCPHCGGRMKLRALVRDRESIERFLRHQNLWTEPLGLAEARPPPYFRGITRLKPTGQAELFE
jgi:hypothetical protein